ncbi:MAG: hypothetical protein WCQ99_10425 [Pseudomonadota bacterium]
MTDERWKDDNIRLEEHMIVPKHFCSSFFRHTHRLSKKDPRDLYVAPEKATAIFDTITC